MNNQTCYSQAGEDINAIHKKIKKNLDECDKLINEIDVMTVAMATALVVKLEAA
jgi:hypothetical protein